LNVDVLDDGNQTNLINHIAQAFNSTPSGVLLPYGGTSAPAGFLLCDGSVVSRTTYANLFAAIGVAWGAGNGTTTFNLPNSAGMFLRGAGSQTVGGVSYAGPALGSSQQDQLQGHIHQQTYNTAGGSSGNNVGNQSGQVNQVAGGNYTLDPANDGGNGVPRYGSETRPVNLGVNYIIKT